MPRLLPIALAAFLLLSCASLKRVDESTFRYGKSVLQLHRENDSLHVVRHLRKGKIVDEWTIAHPCYRFDCGDLTGDGVPEILVGPVKRTKYRADRGKRLFIFHLFRGKFIRPLWLGSRVGGPLVDFKVEDGMVHTWEEGQNGDTIQSLYKHGGFGLQFVKYLND